MDKILSNKINDCIKTNHQSKPISDIVKEIKNQFQLVLSHNAIAKRLQRIRKKNPDSIELPKDSNDSFLFEEFGNTANVETKTKTNPKTLDELLKVCGVDSNIWKVERHVINKWEVGAKDESGKIVTTPLYQVKAFLIRKIAVQQSIPVIQSVEIKIPSKTISKPRDKGILERALIIPDSHNGFRRNNLGELIPLHDRDAWNLILQVIKDEKFDRIILLGDMLDFAEWSDKFTKTPDFYWMTQPALFELAWWLGKLKNNSKPNTQIDYLEGNHEARLPRLLNNHLIAAYNLHSVGEPRFPVLSVNNLLNLSELGITYHNDYPNGEIWLNDNLCCSHGSMVRNGSGETTKSMVQKARCSEIFGHIHRMEMACITKHSKKGPISYKAFSPGTIARIDGVVPGHSSKNNWQQGFAKVEYESGNGLFEITPVTINNGKCIYDGKLYESNFDLENMIEEINKPEFKF